VIWIVQRQVWIEQFMSISGKVLCMRQLLDIVRAMLTGDFVSLPTLSTKSFIKRYKFVLTEAEAVGFKCYSLMMGDFGNAQQLGLADVYVPLLMIDVD
jgi:hypothetical protein